MMSEQIVVISIVIFYLLAMLVIGWWASKKIHGIADFFVAGRRLGIVLATATMFATWFGACSSMGTAGTVYKNGIIGVISDPFGAALALIIAGIFYAVAFRRRRYLTVIDIFRDNYSKGTEITAALLMIPVYIGWLGSQIVAIGFIFSAFTKVDPNIGMIIGTLVTLIYTYFGGMWALTITDFFQMIILVVGILIIFPFAIGGAGGFANIISSTPKEYLTFLPQTKSFDAYSSYLGQWLLMGLGCVVGQDLIQRSLSSKTAKVARWSAIYAGIIYLLMGFVVIFIALAGRIIFPSLDNPENVIPFLAQKYLGGIHPFMMAIFVSGLLAAIMSSADSSLLAAVSLFINNVLKKLYPNMTDKKLLSASKIATIVFTALSMFIALYIQQVYNLMVNSWSTLLVAIFVPVTVALFWKKFVSVKAAWASMLIGTGVWIFYIIFKTGGFDINDSNMHVFYSASFLGFLASILAYCAVLIVKRISLKVR